jgi:hypothetical protein
MSRNMSYDHEQLLVVLDELVCKSGVGRMELLRELAVWISADFVSHRRTL